VFPKAFSCDFEEYKEGQRFRYGQWYYSQALNVQRYDELGTADIMDYTKEQDSFISFHFQSAPTCTTKKISGSIPNYSSLSSYTYSTTKDFEGYQIQVWERNVTDGVDFYYCRNIDQVPVGFEKIRNGKRVSFRVFRNMDISTQDKNLFNTSYVAPGACSNQKKNILKTPISKNSISKNQEKELFSILPGCSPVESCSFMQSLVEGYFSSSYQNDMLCIAFYESSYCPGVYNGICCYGLFQINSNHLGESGCPSSVSALYNPDTNAACAAHILSTQGLNAWQTWSEGDCDSWSRCTV
jgi:hypothetical protein